MTKALEQVAELQAERARDAEAIVAVLGDPAGNLTPAQQRVWAWLRRNAFLDQSTVRADNDGTIDTQRMLLHEGARTLVVEMLKAVKLFNSPRDQTAGRA